MIYRRNNCFSLILILSYIYNITFLPTFVNSFFEKIKTNKNILTYYYLF
nr:MAG TPA_asm: hypothetical protein [Caudoviricetes sp.]DAL61310.1 MAG TPA_asm: hypothetical protein [Bacteriophage sp.]